MYLKKFAIFNLANYSFSLTHLQELSCILYFFTLPSGFFHGRNAKLCTLVYLCTLGAGFSQVAKNCQVLCQTVEGVFSTFLPKSRTSTRFSKPVEMLSMLDCAN
jgi:hypothetical protein